MAVQEIGRDTTIGTYRAAGWPSIDFDVFHREILPARLADGVNERVVWDVEGRAPLTLGLPDGHFYTYSCSEGRVRVTPGVDAAARPHRGPVPPPAPI